MKERAIWVWTVEEIDACFRAVKACRGGKCREVPGSCYIDDGETTSCRVKSSRCTNQSCHILDAIFQKIIKSLEVKLLLCSSKKRRKTCTAGE